MTLKTTLQKNDQRGVAMALLLIGAWGINLFFLLNRSVSFNDPLTYLFVLLQTHLYTGLFITAHDAMHGVVSRQRRLNTTIGWVCATLFAFNFYGNLFHKHHQHHRFAGTDRDPDYHKGHFWAWYFSFVRQYVNLWQLLLMAVTFNLLIQFFPQSNVVLYWMLPSILSTFQLFYFGTYLPHRGEHAEDDPHKSHSQPKNHLWAFLSCYFFGYHHEHHRSPATPWWLLYKVKEEANIQ